MKINRDLIIVAGGRIISAILGILIIRVVTTLLSPEQYGELTLFVVIQTFCNLILVSPIGVYISRHTHEWWENGSLVSKLHDYKKYVFFASLIGGLFSILIFYHHPIISIISTAFVLIFIINCATWNATLISLLNMIGSRGAATSLTLLTIIVSLLMSVAFYSISKTALAWFFGQSIGFMLGAIGAVLVVRENVIVKSLPDSETALDKQSLLTYCLPLLIGTAFMWFQISGYRLLVEHYWGLTMLGMFSVGVLLANQIWSLVELLAQQFLYPLFYKSITHTDEGNVERAFTDLVNVLIPIYLVLAGMIYLAAPYLLKLIVTTEYSGSELFLKLGSGIEFCRVTAGLLSNAAHVTKQTRAIVWPYVVGAIVALILIIFIGVFHFDIYWVGYCLLFAAFAMLSVMFIMMYQQVKFALDFWRCFISSLILIGFLIFSFWQPYPRGPMEAIMILITIKFFIRMSGIHTCMHNITYRYNYKLYYYYYMKSHLRLTNMKFSCFILYQLHNF